MCTLSDQHHLMLASMGTSSVRAEGVGQNEYTSQKGKTTQT